MKINNYKNNLLVNFYIHNNIYKNTVSKNSGILFLKIKTKIETECIPFLKIATNLNSISNFRNGIEIRFYFRNGIYSLSIFTHEKLIFILYNEIFK